MREVDGLILFRYPSLDPKTAPWASLEKLRRFNLREVALAFARRRPDHPLSAVLQPVLLSSPKTLEENAQKYYHTIKSSDLDEQTKTTLLEVFVSWLEQRFKNKGKQEIEKMLLGDLPDLRETQSGKDLMPIGPLRFVKKC